MTVYQQQIQLPKAAFRKSRNEYSMWRMAWVREILQNSYDALLKVGGGRIDFVFDGKIVTVTDTGCGMNEDVLLNVLLSWAGSNKQMGDGSVGGFGYAKNLLYFANERFEIWSQDNYVVGEGGQFNHSKSAEVFEGTRSRVEFEDAYHVTAMQNYLRDFCKLFDPECPLEISINGELEPLGQSSSVMTNHYAAKFGELWYYEEKQAQTTAMCYVTVRVKGLPMFTLSRDVHAAQPLHAVLDIDIERNNLMDLLTANRDSFKGGFGEDLTRLMDTLANERSKAKRGEKFSFVLNQFSLHEAELYDMAVPVGYEVTVEGQDNIIETDNADAAEQLALANDNIRNFPNNFAIRSAYRLGTKEGKGVIKYLGNRKSAALAHTWREVVKHVLASGAVQNITYHTAAGEIAWEENDGYGEFRHHGRPVHMGFIFEDNIEGELSRENNCHSVNMNPNMLWDDWLIGDLIDLAAHEITHLTHSYHNEQFIVMLDEIRKHLRRYTDEVSLNRWIDQHLRAVGLRGRK